MRCLYCNKKLSLLKLAKGDSFCSPEHFDAHQLQLSKSAYERLVATPADDVPRAPLVVTPREEGGRSGTAVEKKDLEADAALARLSAFRAPEKEPPADVQPPPYAGFLPSPPPSNPPEAPPPIANLDDANDAAQSPCNLALPVHEVEATVCLLNLYVRLGLSETSPLDWTPPWHHSASPQDFAGQITRPLLAFRPDFRHFEHLAPIKPPEPIEAAHSIEPLPTVDLAFSIQPALPIEMETRPAEPEHRLPFLTAPSFRERTAEAIPLDMAASSAPDGLLLVPLLDPAQALHPDWSGVISQNNSFAGTSRPAHDVAAQSMPSGSELPIGAAPVLPEERKGVRFDRWHVSDGFIGITRSAVDVPLPSTKPIAFQLPERAPVPPRPALAPILDRRSALTSNRTLASLFRGVLETHPRGPEPALPGRALRAIESGLLSILAPFPAPRTFSVGAWQPSAPPISLPAELAQGAEPPKFLLQPVGYQPDCVKPNCMTLEFGGARTPALGNAPLRPMPWRRADIAPPPSEPPAPVVPALRFLASPDISSQPALIAGTVRKAIFERSLTAAPNVIFEQPNMASIAPATLPEAVDMPSSNSSLGACALAVSWEPVIPTSPQAPVLRFLPVRKNPILPSARTWPRLGDLPH